jgi:hypothetical protein
MLLQRLSRSAGQEFLHLLWNPELHFCVHKNLHFDSILTLLPYRIKKVKSKVKQSLYTPWRRLGGEEV